MGLHYTSEYLLPRHDCVCTMVSSWFNLSKIHCGVLGLWPQQAAEAKDVHRLEGIDDDVGGLIVRKKKNAAVDG